MMLEQVLSELLGPLVSGRFYPDTAPDVPAWPLGFYQQVGGDGIIYSEMKVPDLRNGRIQIQFWAPTRMAANQLALLAQKEIVESGLAVQVFGDFIALYDDNIKKYGTRQDFGIWNRE